MKTFKNIKVKLLFWYTIITSIVLTIFSVILLNQFQKESIKGVDKQLITVVNEINYAKHFYEPFDLEEFMIKNLFITIYKYEDKKFKKVIATNSSVNIGNFRILRKTYTQIFTSKEHLRVVRLHTDKANEDIYIEVATTIEDKIGPSIAHLKGILNILVPILLIITIFAGYMNIKNSLKPVKKTIDEVKDIELHKLNERVTSYTYKDEIEELVETFNFMLDKLDDSVSKIKRFSNDVSHELKTPLTVIRGEIELGLRKERTNEEYKAILINVLEETKQLQELINSLLFLSKANDEEIKEKFEFIEFDDITLDVISSNKKLLKEKNIKIDFKNFESVTLKAHPLLIKILIGNIVQNAIKYSHKDSKIEICLSEDRLKVKDYGIGIKKQDMTSIFDRFYRVDKSRGRGGYGLGLSIVKSIATIHGFDLGVDSEYEKFTEFTVFLHN
jgi:signal transduction histidine kinase